MKLFFPLAFLVSTSVVLADDKKQIKVQGQCEIKVVPDRGTITFTAENQSYNQKDAVKKTNDQINRLMGQIKALQLKDQVLKTTTYSVYPIREYEKDKYVDKGTRAALSLEVITSDISKLGETLVLASKLNIQHVGSLQTFLSTEKSNLEYLKCLQIAANDAKAKANQLAKSLGFKVGEVIELVEGPKPPVPPVFPERTMLKGASTDIAPANIEAGQQQFTTSIEVSFAIK